MKRREFLGRLTWWGSVGALGALAHPFPAGAFAPVDTATATRKKEVMLEQLALSDFSPHRGGRFWLRLDSGRKLELELIEATLLGRQGARPAHLAQREPFSIVFRAPKDASLSQQIYRLEHAQMGEFEVFLVPIGRNEAGLLCEAIFN